MLSRHGENVKRREFGRLAPSAYVEFSADPPNEYRAPSFRWKHPAQKKQIARLHRFHIGPERLGGHRKFNAEFLQPLLGAYRPRAFAGHRLSMCAASTCSTSTVHLTGFDPLIGDFWVRGVSIVADILSPEISGRIAGRAHKSHAGDEEKESTPQAAV